MGGLCRAGRRRTLKCGRMIPTNPEQWDYEALSEVLAYKPIPKQAWDSTDIGGPWLNLIRNALNAEIWSFKHPDFLAVSVTPGTANLPLYHQATWDKYHLTKLAREKFKHNTLIDPPQTQTAHPP